MSRSTQKIAAVYDVEPKAADLADRRTRALIHPHLMTVATVSQLLRSAYLQGLNDAIEVAASKDPAS